MERVLGALMKTGRSLGFEPARRPLGPAVLTGAVRGAVASIFPVPALGLGVAFGWHDPKLALLAALVGFALAAALGATEALASRAPSSWDLGARFLGGGFAVLVASLPLFGTFGAFSFPLPWLTVAPSAEAFSTVAWAAVSLGTGLALGGPHAHGASVERRIRRALVVSIVGACVFGMLGLFPVPTPFALGACCGLGALYAVGHLVGRDAARALGGAVEETTGVTEAEREEDVRRAEAGWRSSLYLAGRAANEATRRHHMEAALRFAEAALAVTLGSEETLAEEWARRVAELLFDLGRLDALDVPVGAVPGGVALLAERSRRQGDVDGAVARARECLEAVATSGDRRASAVRVNAHAVLALAARDQGDVQAAERHLRWARAELAWADPLIRDLHPDSVAAALVSART